MLCELAGNQHLTFTKQRSAFDIIAQSLRGHSSDGRVLIG